MSTVNFSVLMGSRKHHYIGAKTFKNIKHARKLRERLIDELNTEITLVPQLALAGGKILHAYFIGDVAEDVIDRARFILKEVS